MSTVYSLAEDGDRIKRLGELRACVVRCKAAADDAVETCRQTKAAHKKAAQALILAKEWDAAAAPALPLFAETPWPKGGPATLLSAVLEWAGESEALAAALNAAGLHTLADYRAYLETPVSRGPGEPAGFKRLEDIPGLDKKKAQKVRRAVERYLEAHPEDTHGE